MPAPTGHLQDDLVIMSGTAGGTSRFKNLSGAGTTVLGGTVNLGANKVVGFRLLVAGAVTGDTPSMAVRIEDSANGSSGWAVRDSFPAQTAQMAGTAEFPRVEIRTNTGRGYLRATAVLTGSSTLAFGSVAVLTDYLYDSSAP